MIGAATVERLAQRLPRASDLRRAASLTDLTRRMSGMVDDLLSIAVSTGGGRSLLKIAPVSAASLLKRAADAARPLFAQRDIELEIEAVGELPEIRVDSDRVLRVFANLLDNALKFTDPQGRVVLRAQTESAGVRFAWRIPGPRFTRGAGKHVPTVLAGRATRPARSRGLGYRSAARSSKRTAAGSGRSRSRASECEYASCCHWQVSARPQVRCDPDRHAHPSQEWHPRGAPRHGIQAHLAQARARHLEARRDRLPGGPGYRGGLLPQEAVVAMVDTTDDRRTVEVGLIGREGIVGINIFLGGVVT